MYRLWHSPYAIGADVSFLAKCEHDSVVFKENGSPKDALAILREHHYNWITAAGLFHDPSAAPDHLPNDLDYTLALARRARQMGFHCAALGSPLLRQLGGPRQAANSRSAWSGLNHRATGGAMSSSYSRERTHRVSPAQASRPIWSRLEMRSPMGCSGRMASSPLTGITSPT